MMRGYRSPLKRAYAPFDTMKLEMSMLRLLRRIVPAVLLVGILLPAAAQPLPTDPRLTTGTLENGLSYIVRRHDNPPARANLWLHVSTGSLNETESQRGIAHFLEHMAFNGSEHFPPGSVIPFFESLGLTFGQHQNAFTSFDQTSYLLALPDNQLETLEKGMRFLSDVAMRLSLPATEIDDERQVILEERRSRLSGRQRVQDQWIEQLAPGSTLGRRIPIGVEETIRGMTRDDFVEYYTRWYTPSNMTMMVVADMDPATVVDQITRSFSTGRKVERPADREVGVSPYAANRALIVSDPELTSTRVEFIWLEAPEPPATTVALLKQEMVTRIATWVFDRRLERLVAGGKASFQRGGPSAGDLFRAARIANLSVSGEPSKWRAMLTELAIETQRARIHGFTEREVEDARRELLSATENAVKTEPTINAGSMLAMWNNAVAEGVPITSAEQDLELVKAILPSITPADISARFNSLFNVETPVTFSLQAPSGSDVPTQDQLLALGLESLKVRPENENESDRPSALMTSLPQAGTIAEQSLHEASGVASFWLANNVRFHHRFMDYKKDQVIVSIVVAGGEIEETAANRGITQAAAVGLTNPATASQTSTDLRDLATGKNIGVRGRAAPDALMITIMGDPDDLEHGLQQAHLMLTEPIVEEAALQIWKDRIRQFAEARKQDVEMALGDVVAASLYPPDEVRFAPLEPAQVASITAQEATEWLRRVLAGGSMEVSIVGDISKARAEELALRYIGSLPPRARISDTTLSAQRTINRPAGPHKATKELATRTNKALVMSGFFGTDSKNLRDVRLLGMATRILSTRAIADIREKRQLAYSPQVASIPAAEYPGYGLVFLGSPTDPEKVDELKAAVQSLFDTFTKHGPTAEEMDTVLKQIGNALDEQVREPAFWSTRLTTLTYRGTSLDEILRSRDAYAGFSAADVREAFSRYHTPKGRFELIIVPAK